MEGMRKWKKEESDGRTKGRKETSKKGSKEVSK